MAASERPITIAMLALGGQGGGVLTKWLVDLAEANGYLAQSTYVAGVAQRTGSTVYCVEMFPRAAADAAGAPPVFVQYPVPGDVDVAIASELAEAGRAIEKGFVTPNRTTLVASSHRVYSIVEKSALGDGIADPAPVLEAAGEASRRFVCFDMQQAADDTGSVISAVILGAVAGCGALPFERTDYEAAIRRSGRAVDANLAGFAAGFAGAVAPRPAGDGADEVPAPVAAGPRGEALLAEVRERFAAECRNLAGHGVLRALGYQDEAYAREYLDRVAAVHALDAGRDGAAHGFALTNTVARELALQMCYEDTIRVAEIKIGSARLAGIGRDIGAQDGQPFYVSEYFHPRYEEFCDTLPAGMARRALASARLRRWTSPLFARGRNISTNKLGGFLLLRALAGLRRWRRMTYRYAIQRERIDDWLAEVRGAAADDYAGAVELAGAIQIVRGYGETYERGLARYEATLAVAKRSRSAERAARVRRLREAAEADEHGHAFARVMQELEAGS